MSARITILSCLSIMSIFLGFAFSQFANAMCLAPSFTVNQTTRLGMYDNEDVRQVQKAINDIRGENLALDGDFGPHTRAAVMRLQQTIGTTPDGIAGPKTYAAIREALNNAECNDTPMSPNEQTYSHTVKQFASRTEAENFLKSNLAKNNTTSYVARNANSAVPAMAMTESADAIGTGGALSGDDFSKTNIQEEGVDEADIIKTDGAYIYTLSSGYVDITKTDDAGDLTKLSKIKIQGSGHDMYLEGNTLVVLSRTHEDVSMPLPKLDGVQVSSDYIMPTYGVSYSTIAFYNITDRSNPRLTKTYDFEGNYMDSRLTGGYVYMITQQYPRWYNGCCNIVPLMREDGVTARLATSPIYYFDMPYQSYAFTQVHGINIKNPESIKESTFLLSGGHTLYASENALYLSYTDYGYRGDVIFMEDDIAQTEEAVTLSDKEPKEQTIIHKIDISRGSATLTATGSVSGHMINQFAMSEYKENLRIATTSGNNWNGDQSENNMYVLNDDLETIGSVEGLAQGEQIYSVRFMGDKGYMVTFEQVDPLFVIDLSNPQKPRVEGELKIPGFSNYLHPYDEDTLLGIGRDTIVDENGRVLQQGIKIALFDVSNVNRPKEIDSLVLGGRGASSEALYNHKAVLFSKEKNLLVIPFQDWDYQDEHNQFTGAAVLSVDTKDGIVLRGKVAHSTQNRWESAIQRNLYISNVLYSLSRSTLQSNDLGTLKKIDTVSLTQDSSQSIIEPMPVVIF